ncbi:MAG: phosphoribosyltransferase family protein [Bacteroidales bacterium]|nr:phosphoribosyltransferase family protein [Bacteroidales bacterium]MDD3664606.1 phosphoribosyltransferase family protein [Bacteroidales bacterium]
MNTLKINDKEFALYLTRHQIEQAVRKVADAITADLDGKDPLFVVVLNGAFMFASDLMKMVNIPSEIAFVRLSSYVGTQSSHVVKEKMSLDKPAGKRPIVIIEDIIDTGITMESYVNRLREAGNTDVRIATLLFKPGAFQKSYPIDYIGLEIPNDFIVGYGLDYDDYGRNLPDIYKIV